MAGPARKVTTSTTRKTATPATKRPAAVQPIAAPPKENTVPAALAELSPMFQEVTEPVAKRNVASKLNPELMKALQISFDLEKRLSIPIDSTPKLVRKGVTTQDANTAANYIRRHAAELGIGVSIVPVGDDRISFLGQAKRVVPTNATGRAPRGSKS